jgi:hypothetical protein
LGRAGDIDEASLTSRDYYATVGQVRAAQDRLAAGIDSPFGLTAEACADTDWVYCLSAADGPAVRLGTLNKQFVNSDLFEIGKIISERRSSGPLRPSSKIRYIHVVATRTVVLPAERLAGLDLHAPWSQSGIFLAPVISAFTMVYFNPYRSRR